jgi:hypothetical protein
VFVLWFGDGHRSIGSPPTRTGWRCGLNSQTVCRSYFRPVPALSFFSGTYRRSSSHCTIAISIENLGPHSAHTFFERYYNKYLAAILCRGFLPRYAYQLRSTFLHLVETSGWPSTGNGPELIGYKVSRKQEYPSTYSLLCCYLG